MLRAFIICFLLISGWAGLILFMIKWIDTDFDTAWDTFDKFVKNCIGGQDDQGT